MSQLPNLLQLPSVRYVLPTAPSLGGGARWIGEDQFVRDSRYWMQHNITYNIFIYIYIYNVSTIITSLWYIYILYNYVYILTVLTILDTRNRVGPSFLGCLSHSKPPGYPILNRHALVVYPSSSRGCCSWQRCGERQRGLCDLVKRGRPSGFTTCYQILLVVKYNVNMWCCVYVV